jgi:hypothetical protein
MAGQFLVHITDYLPFETDSAPYSRCQPTVSRNTYIFKNLIAYPSCTHPNTTVVKYITRFTDSPEEQISI